MSTAIILIGLAALAVCGCYKRATHSIARYLESLRGD